MQSTSLHAPGTAHVDRRGLMMAGAAGLLMLQVEPASAGLVQFPANRFNNRCAQRAGCHGSLLQLGELVCRSHWPLEPCTHKYY